MSSLPDKNHIGLSWRFCSYSTSRKILRHPKLEQGTLREGLGPIVHHSSPCRSGTAVHIDSAIGTALHWSSSIGPTRLESEPLTQNEPSEDVDVFCHFRLVNQKALPALPTFILFSLTRCDVLYGSYEEAFFSQVPALGIPPGFCFHFSKVI